MVDNEPFRGRGIWAIVTVTVVTVLFSRVAVSVFSIYNLLIIN